MALKKSMKNIVVIGAGQVGSHIVSACMLRGLPGHFWLVDQDQAMETAQVLDLKDTLLECPQATVQCGDYTDAPVRGADLLIITAGAAQQPGETRLDLLAKNTAILRSIRQEIGELTPTTKILLVTNPVDLLTQYAVELWPHLKGQILGSGTLLDTGRLRWRLAAHASQSITGQTGYVLGEHGLSSVIAWSQVEGSDHLSADDKAFFLESVRQAAYEIQAGKGATYFGVAAAVSKIIEVWEKGSAELLPLSVETTGHYDLPSTYLSLPVRFSAENPPQVEEIPLSEAELEGLKCSAENLVRHWQDWKNTQ